MTWTRWPLGTYFPPIQKVWDITEPHGEWNKKVPRNSIKCFSHAASLFSLGKGVSWDGKGASPPCPFKHWMNIEWISPTRFLGRSQLYSWVTDKGKVLSGQPHKVVLPEVIWIGTPFLKKAAEKDIAEVGSILGSSMLIQKSFLQISLSSPHVTVSHWKNKTNSLRMTPVPSAITHLNCLVTFCLHPGLSHASCGWQFSPREHALLFLLFFFTRACNYSEIWPLQFHFQAFEMKMSRFKIGQCCQQGDAWKQRNIYGNKKKNLSSPRAN